jgi:hypothetical protein
MIFIFLNDKLISADTFLPIALEMRSRTNDRIEFHCFDARTYKAIGENEIIARTMASIGTLHLLTDHRRSTRNEFTIYRLKQRIAAAIRLARILIIVLTRRTTLIHFKALNRYPLRLLYLANRRRTILVQSSAADSSELEAQLDRLVKERFIDSTAPAASVLVHFNEHWPPLEDYRLTAVPRYRVTVPYRRKAWLTYLLEWRDSLLANYGIASGSGAVCFMCNTMSTDVLLDENTSFKVLFRQTLEILAEELPDVPVLVKRHPATTPEIASIQADIVRTVGHHISFTNLHPQLLALHSLCFIGNWYSSTFLHAKLFEVPTIQYTHSSPNVRGVTGDGNPRPDLVSHYIDNDPSALRILLRTLSPARGEWRSIVDCDPMLEANYDHVLNLMVGRS